MHKRKCRSLKLLEDTKRAFVLMYLMPKAPVCSLKSSMFPRSKGGKYTSVAFAFPVREGSSLLRFLLV